MLVFICTDNLVLVSNPCAWAEARGSGAQLASGGGLGRYFAPLLWRAWLRGELEGAKSSGASAACDCLSRLPFLRTMCQTAA